MELNKIQSTGNWGKVADDLNQNFTKVNTAVEQIKNATTRNRGYFSSEEALNEAFPSANVGDIAYVGISYPYQTWAWNGTIWEKKNEAGGEESVNLGDYYTKRETDEKFTEADAKLAELGSYQKNEKQISNNSFSSFFANNIFSEDAINLVFEEGKFFSSVENRIKENSAYVVATVDATSYRGKWIHIRTSSYGSAYGVVLHDGANIISNHFDPSNDKLINGAVYIPENTVYIYINYYLNIAQTNRGAWVISSIIDNREQWYEMKSIVSYQLSTVESSVDVEPSEIISGKRFNLSGVILDLESMSIYKWENIKEGEVFVFSAYRPKGYSNSILGWYNANGVPLKTEYKGEGTEELQYNEQMIIVPPGASYLLMNTFTAYPESYNIKRVSLKFDRVDELTSKIDNTRKYLKDRENVEPNEILRGKRVNIQGSILDHSGMSLFVYNVSEGDIIYFNAYYPSGYITSILNLFDLSNNYIGSAFETVGNEEFVEQVYIVPKGVSYIYMNTVNAYSDKFYILKEGGFIYSMDLKKSIKQVNDKINKLSPSNLMKVHIYNLHPSINNDMFFVRTRYNDKKDILLLYKANDNTCIRPDSAYIGDNSLSDDELRNVNNRVSYHADSTAPLFNSSVYWHLFAQHGYPIPYIDNNVGLTTDDVDSIWIDQLNREFRVGKVTSDTIYLLPTIYKDENGNDKRDWVSGSSKEITTLTHVTGGVNTSSIIVDETRSYQIEPIMKYFDRLFIIDGKEVTESGDYYCDEFKVSESQIGYDPASVKTWFPSPDLETANEMARFTWSYNFKGAQCCVNTTIDIRTRVECQSYGATQQQTFFDNGNYKAMFVIPKAASRNGVELDKPFNSASASAPTYSFYRTSGYLKDVDDPIDRLIGFLHNPTDDTYLFGMAAGLSLVSGDTIREKRIASMPIGDKNAHYRVGSISPSNTNKFYIAAVNTAKFEDDYYHFPTTYFKEINYYVSYFDPSENEGQVYWYKDGSNYVIYMHCQTVQNKLAINLPDFMEGLKIEIVEKTEGSTLLTNVIQNGKLYVNYNGDANYIVVKTV